MAILPENHPAVIELEQMVDAHTLYAVVTALETICHGKAEHLETNWQDREAAKRWTCAAKVFERAALKLQSVQQY